MTPPRRTLGTLLRHVIELLDGAVEQGYVDAGLDFRPRYTPVLRVLMNHDAMSIKALAEHAGLTHSAASQTLAQMRKHGLIDARKGKDQREQVVSLTPKARAMIPEIRRAWKITDAAAEALEAEVGFALSQRLEDVIEALERQSFRSRRQAAAERLD